MPWAIALWLTTAAGCLLGPIGGQWLLDRLPQSEPDPARHANQVALAASRLLMTSRITPEALTTLLDQWAASPSLGANDCLYGALLTERNGHSTETLIWLSLEALSRGDRQRATTLLEGTGVDLRKLEQLLATGTKWLSEDPLGQRLTEAMAGDSTGNGS